MATHGSQARIGRYNGLTPPVPALAVEIVPGDDRLRNVMYPRTRQASTSYNSRQPASPVLVCLPLSLSRMIRKHHAF